MLPGFKLNNKRATVRLNMEVGTVELCRAGLPPLTCSLRDLSEGGCQISRVPDPRDTLAYPAWKIFLITTQAKSFPVQMQLTSGSVLSNFPLAGEVRFFRVQANGTMQFGVCFTEDSKPKTEMMQRAILNVAM